MSEDLQAPGVLCIESFIGKTSNEINEEPNEAKIIHKKSYILKLEKDEYILEMKINEKKEIIFTLYHKNILSLDYFESKYNLNSITEKTKLIDKPSIETIYQFYDEKLLKKNRINLRISEDKILYI